MEGPPNEFSVGFRGVEGATAEVAAAAAGGEAAAVGVAAATGVTDFLATAGLLWAGCAANVAASLDATVTVG